MSYVKWKNRRGPWSKFHRIDVRLAGITRGGFQTLCGKHVPRKRDGATVGWRPMLPSGSGHCANCDRDLR